jgi:hypothetical protein
MKCTDRTLIASPDRSPGRLHLGLFITPSRDLASAPPLIGRRWSTKPTSSGPTADSLRALLAATPQTRRFRPTVVWSPTCQRPTFRQTSGRTVNPRSADWQRRLTPVVTQP